MEKKYLNHNTVDAFYGMGWDNWGRFKIAHKQDGIRYFQVAGNRWPKEKVQELEATHQQ